MYHTMDTGCCHGFFEKRISPQIAMSQKAINERAIRVTTLENLNDHLRKMPGISGVTGVSKGDSQNDFDAISSSMGDVVSSQPGRRARSTRTSVQNEEKREIVVNAEAAAGIVKYAFKFVGVLC